MFGIFKRRSANESGPERDARALKALRPFFRRQVVESKVRLLFPAENSADILKLLDTDLPTVWGLERLQLAILKLSDGNLERLHHYVDAAKDDFLDVIGSAEYPEALSLGLENYLRMSNPEQEVIHKRDLRQYLRWLKKR